MTVGLRVYSKLEEFSLNDAAYLFLDRQPLDEYEYQPPKEVSDMQRLLNKKLSHLKSTEGLALGQVHPQTGEFYFASASRASLLEVAKVIGLTPKFLFPDEGEGMIEPWELYAMAEKSAPKNPPPVTDWELYDIFTGFTAFQAAHLWFEVEPVNRLGYIPPFHVEKLIETIAGGRSTLNSHNSVVRTREELKELAIKLGVMPKFLFPESRNSEKPLNSKKRNSYLKLLKGVFVEKGIDFNQRAIAKTLAGYTERAGCKLGEDAIRSVLEELQNLSED
jgi:hypothetical protein